MRKGKKLTLAHVFVFLFLCALGATLILFAYQNIAQSYDRRALNTIRALSAALDTDDVRSLSGSEGDLQKPEYLALKNRLAQTFSATFDANSAYFFTLREGAIYFMADSEPIGTAESSPSGQRYKEAPPEAYSVFASDQPLMTKAYSDRWGRWISAYMLLPQGDGNIPIAFGLDYRAESFYTHAKLTTAEISFLALALLLLFLVAFHALKNNALLEIEKEKANEVSALFKTLQQKERQERLQAETTLQSLGEAVISTDKEGIVVIMNKMAQQLTGWEASEAIGKPIKDVFRVVDGLTLKPFEKSWPHNVLETGIPIPYDNKEVRLIRKNGSLLAIEDMVSPILDEEGNITGVVLIFVDGTEKRLQKDELLYLSTHDGLTGLLNRQAFYQKLQEMDVPKHFPLVLMLLDINGLKLINEAYGHATGDSLLNEIAIILQRPGHRGQMVGRVDGDEFAIFFPNATEEIAMRVAQEIQDSLADQSFLGYALTISIGYAKKEYAQTTIEELHKRAEDDLLRNKLVENQSARLKMVDLLMQSLFKKSAREMEHSKRIGLLAKRFGIYLGLPKEEVESLYTVGIMHDIGKIAITSKILNKQSKLDDEEWKDFQRHPEIGFNILSSVNQYAPIAEQVLCHHERWDGKGYPNQIAGDLIPYFSRILALCEAFDSMTTYRTYRTKVSVEKALEEIRLCSNSHYDPTLAAKFIEMLQKGSDNSL